MSDLPLKSLDAQLRERLFEPLARLRQRCRLYVVLRGLLAAFLGILAALVGQLLLDRWLKLPFDQRAVLTIVIAIFSGWLIYRFLLKPLFQPLEDKLLAALVDRSNPALRDRIASTVQFAVGQVGDEKQNSPQLVQAVLRETCEQVGRLSFLNGLDHRRAARRAATVGGLALSLVALCGFVPDLRKLVQTWFQRNWLLRDVSWPQRTHIYPLAFQDGRRRVPRGDEFEIAARVEGEMPTAATLYWRTASGQRGSASMTLVGEARLEAAIGQVAEDLHFYIAGGDERTREFMIEAVERPQVLHTKAVLTPPAYTKLGPVAVEQQTVFEVLKGGGLEIEARTNKPVAQAQFVGEQGLIAECESIGEDRLRVRWPQPVAGSYRFELVDRDGWKNARPVRFTIKIVPDKPPSARLESAGVGEVVTPQAELALDLKFKDDYGLAVAELKVQKGDAAPQSVALDGFTAGLREFQPSARWAVAALKAAPGERVRLWGEATDNDPQGPNTARSPVVELRVLSEEDFLAEMERRELELRREFEHLITSQRTLKNTLDQLQAVLTDGSPPVAVAQRLLGLSRQQEGHAGRCLAIAKQFEKILAEMRTNKVAKTGDERRITDRIVAPLNDLGRQVMPGAAATLSSLSRAIVAPQRENLTAAQTEILRRMQTILANMLEWEGYREAVALLREIIAQQGELRTATREALEKKLQAILDLDLPPETQPAKKPKP